MGCPPAPVEAGLAAVVGIAVNGGTALLFMRGRTGDLNVRGAFLHLASEALVSVGVVVSALLIGLTGWLWLDPVTSLATDAVPEGVDRPAVQAALPGVTEEHDLHIWGLSTTRIALTAHLVAEQPQPALVGRVSFLLRDRFDIEHATLQMETAENAAACALRPDHVV